ncbi:MAG: hypothetical protein GY705_17930, partial [Bacteroidetes bacterium]|nr:hypothetical protein [Bacteroidota bacterium]
LLVGFIPVGFGVPVWILLAIGFVGLFFTVKFIGKQLDEEGEIVENGQLTGQEIFEK